MTDAPQFAADYIVVGSGAGGGTVAARLAEAGMRVLLLEAGSDPAIQTGPGLPEDYEVPAFHSFASENLEMVWNFRVHDFGDDAGRQGPSGEDGRSVLYPRAVTLGGCTAHNAMIFMAPHRSDWDNIADLTGDDSWRADAMQRYFQRVENCGYRPLWRCLSWLTAGRINPSGHGWNGWLKTEVPWPRRAFGDHRLMKVIRAAIRADLAPEETGGSWLQALPKRIERLARFVVGKSDPNDLRLQGKLAEGLCILPLSTANGRRNGSRERVLAAAKTGHLRIEYNALAVRVLLDEKRRATGVEYRKGRNLYRASPLCSGEIGALSVVHAKKEVILSGGTFNSPQLLMLSGIGPVDVLSAAGIPVQVALRGVGQNLQDRYEIGLVHKASGPWSCMKAARFTKGDGLFKDWQRGRGMYASNGVAVAFAFRSDPARPDPDLFVMALLTKFSGYFTGYSEMIRTSKNDLTFASLKAHTQNRGGTVTLASADPRDPPLIDFRGFEEGTDATGEDLASVITGIHRVRRMAAAMQKDGTIAAEYLPGLEVQGEALVDQVRRHAWGHHACGSCAIGPVDGGGVLDSDFRVHGTTGLRVVDASAFPRIPGFFIACAVYMIGEKAADVILHGARSGAGLGSGE